MLCHAGPVATYDSLTPTCMKKSGICSVNEREWVVTGFDIGKPKKTSSTEKNTDDTEGSVKCQCT